MAKSPRSEDHPRKNYNNIQNLLCVAQDADLTEWEENFISGIIDRIERRVITELSQKQYETLEKIAKRAEESEELMSSDKVW